MHRKRMEIPAFAKAAHIFAARLLFFRNAARLLRKPCFFQAFFQLLFIFIQAFLRPAALIPPEEKQKASARCALA